MSVALGHCSKHGKPEWYCGQTEVREREAATPCYALSWVSRHLVLCRGLHMQMQGPASTPLRDVNTKVTCLHYERTSTQNPPHTTRMVVTGGGRLTYSTPQRLHCTKQLQKCFPKIAPSLRSGQKCCIWMNDFVGRCLQECQRCIQIPASFPENTCILLVHATKT